MRLRNLLQRMERVVCLSDYLDELLHGYGKKIHVRISHYRIIIMM
jgi:hypothetical protein